MFAELESADGEQRLRAIFVTHELVVRGTSLRRIETALQSTELSRLACVPRRYEHVHADGQPVVREILVTEVKNVPEA